jgi:murein DD-endopeptidase MepM/ murein hydrolase activator NlpD
MSNFKNKVKELIKSIKEFGHFYILLVPERSSRESKTRRFSPVLLLALIVLYTGFIGFLGFLVLRTSPVDNIVFTNPGLSDTEKQMISELDNKMKLLVSELDYLRSYNTRLQLAIQLGDSTLLDTSTTSAVKKPAASLKAGGNILGVIRHIFSGIFEEEKEEFFFLKPVNGFVSRDFFPEKGHMGIDYIVKTGTPVYSTANGYILFADYTEKDGYKIIISHPDNFVSIYKHCSYLVKKEKDIVIHGELIALSGNTGEVTSGPHLHFEIWQNGKPVDPKNLLIDN